MNKLYLLGGFGNYEYVHTGLHASFKQVYFMEASFGIRPWKYHRERYFMGYYALGIDVSGRKNKPGKMIPAVQWKTLVWNFEDRYTKFIVLAFNPEIRLGYKLNEHLLINGACGIVYNSMLYYKRKTYLEVAWPDEFQPSFSVQINYQIK